MANKPISQLMVCSDDQDSSSDDVLRAVPSTSQFCVIKAVGPRRLDDMGFG